jgi:hypothetical protein
MLKMEEGCLATRDWPVPFSVTLASSEIFGDSNSVVPLLTMRRKGTFLHKDNRGKGAKRYMALEMLIKILEGPKRLAKEVENW